MKVLFLTIFLLSLSAHATPRVGNGGDDLGVEFQSSFETSLSVIKAQLPLVYKQIAHIDFNDLEKNTKVLVVDDSLNVQFKDIVQNSVAINIPDTQEIFINRERWNKIFDPPIKQAIALHEYLSLKGLEQTGIYTISSQFLTLFGLSADNVLLMNPANPIQAAIDQSPAVPPVQIIHYFFDRADSKFDFDDVPTIAEALAQKPMSCLVAEQDSFSGNKSSSYLVKKDVTPAGSSEKAYSVFMVYSRTSLQELMTKDILTVTGLREGLATSKNNEISETSYGDIDPEPSNVSFRKFGDLLVYRFLTMFNATADEKQSSIEYYGFCAPNP